jgi:hypothetical protein
MTLILGRAPEAYSQAAEEERNRALQVADQENYKRNNDVRVKGTGNPDIRGARLILRADDGSLWQIVVSNGGALSTVSVPV